MHNIKKLYLYVCSIEISNYFLIKYQISEIKFLFKISTCKLEPSRPGSTSFDHRDFHSKLIFQYEYSCFFSIISCIFHFISGFTIAFAKLNIFKVY